MHQRCRGNQRIPLATFVRHMEPCASLRYSSIDGQYSPGKFGQQLLIKPVAKYWAPSSVLTLDAQHALLQFQARDDRDDQGRRAHRLRPGPKDDIALT